MKKLKKEWERTTRECSFQQLHPELIKAINDEISEAGNVELDICICVETYSKQLKVGGLSGLLAGGGRKDWYTAVIVTPRWLIFAAKNDKNKPQTFAVMRYLEKMIVDFDSVEAGRSVGIDDYGISVLSLGRTLSRGNMFIGLGRELAAEKLIETLRDAIAKADEKA